MMNFIKKYLAKREMEIVSRGEYENLSKFRIVKSDLKKTIDEFNNLVKDYSDNCAAKALKEKLQEKGVDIKGLSKEQIQEEFVKAFKKDFK